MHGMTGFELLKNIKKIDVKIPIILMSVYDIIEFYVLEGIKINGFIQTNNNKRNIIHDRKTL
jgi:FixJ family two-component response regulator